MTDNLPVHPDITLNAYEKKQEQRRTRYQQRAAKALLDSDAAYRRHNAIMEGIPTGQPILIDHYSGKRHLRALEKCHAAMQKSRDLDKKAQHSTSKAEAVGFGGISSDDPDAIVKLQAKMTSLQNLKPKRYGTAAEIRRLKKRIASLEHKKTIADWEVEENGYVYRQATAENRCMFIFDDKPDEFTRALLKKNGFRWTPTRSAWTRQLTRNAQCSARELRRALMEGIPQ